MHVTKTLSWLAALTMGALILTACGSAAQPTAAPNESGGVTAPTEQATQPPAATESPTESANPAQPAGGLAGTSWKLTQIDATPVDPAVEATLAFDADKATGKGGCNSFGGGYSVSGSSITFSEIAWTLMACDDAHMAVEGKYLPVLDGTATFTQTADTLVITGAKGVKLTFAAIK